MFVMKLLIFPSNSVFFLKLLDLGHHLICLLVHPSTEQYFQTIISFYLIED